ncbi:uncharacterized protein LOC110689525 [Chenopodium quinoa]|uniref:uncharacterized protein LOC110689525 n=1 Tax=Chenopodium quinoa TaxID=63459 RepID=UPI000B7710C6|nr:uncharacterized protein LOC110689525 [Chenopodium quinoa]
MTKFRPISLCNVVYKILSKVLVSRLKFILPGLISHHQSAFVPGRLITDNAIVAFEIFHALKRRKEGRAGTMALKLYMSKAYDRVEWSFLEKVMCRMGFCGAWIQKMLMSFSALLSKAANARLITGAQIWWGAPRVSHLLFADDSILFARATLQECSKIADIIGIYERASGQKINFDKYEVSFSKCVDVMRRMDILAVLGVKQVEKHEKYLGLPTIIRRSKKAVFACLKERIWKKMQGWKEKLLSQAGKEVLIKAVAQAISTYMMGLFHIPDSLIDEIHAMIARFGGDRPWRVGDGGKINVWEDFWLPSDSGIKIPTVNVESPADLCVAELIDHKRHCWDVEALHQHLIAEDIAIVQGLLLSLNNVSNSMYWSPATDGMYSTTKSSYWLARMGHVSGWTERFRGDRAAIWNAIWNNGGPPKLCQFLWRACTKSLATLGRLRQRHVRDNGVCGVFHNSQESIVHAIFLCPNVSQVWDFSPFADLLRDAPSESFFDKFTWVKGKLNKSDLLEFAAFAWATWSYRNSVVFDNSWQNRDVRVLGFLRLVKDYKKYNNVVRVSSPTAVARNEWKPPSAVFIRINSDAAVINENNASIGMVLRDEQGVMVAAKVKRIAGMPSIKVLEAMAARMGL